MFQFFCISKIKAGGDRWYEFFFYLARDFKYFCLCWAEASLSWDQAIVQMLQCDQVYSRGAILETGLGLKDSGQVLGFLLKRRMLKVWKALFWNKARSEKFELEWGWRLIFLSLGLCKLDSQSLRSDWAPKMGLIQLYFNQLSLLG